jgi:hypothetical protein
MNTAYLHSKNVKHSEMRIAGMHMFSTRMPTLTDTKMLVGLHIQWLLELLKTKIEMASILSFRKIRASPRNARMEEMSYG